MTLYENNTLINSFRAVNAETGAIIESDDEGFIEVQAGTKIVFTHPADASDRIPVNTLVFTAGDSDLTVALNDNEVYPLLVRAGETKGVGYMYVQSFTVLAGGSFYYEALANL